MTPPSPSNGRKANVLFVCLGNICRSTMAEGVFRSVAAAHPLINKIDSCGTGAYHAGEGADRRTMATLRRHGINDYKHAARKITLQDFLEFDYLLAMDQYNLEDLLDLRSSVIASQKNPGSNRPARDRGTREAMTATLDANVERDAQIAEVRLFGDFRPGGTLTQRIGGGEVVEDPYYGGADGFEEVYEQVVQFSKNFLEHLEKKTQN
ncbi:phosphotyrosine protein phosphatase I superfamily [Aspergillus pseudodeflectus]|uniref:Phosphotyrosine protein phosphatase I superfamily n=1 Tax=Aspergillus pseudodeflectus TaxID=176178 RepID=A0ABR4KJ73_9EURO